MKEEKKICLVLGSHAHVPSGASEKEFEFVYENKIRPFVSNLYRYSNIQAVLHYSGVLLYWVERTHPEFFMLIEDMITRKQTELLGGGFYEPMFPLIPLQDKIGQIELLTTYLRRHFGKRPIGCWLPSMAWEQHLASALFASDMNYTFLSQEQFSMAGMGNRNMFFPCITEDQGKLVTIFPVFTSIEAELAGKSFSHVFNEFIKKLEEEQGASHSKIIISVFPEKVSSDPEEAPDTAWNRFFEEISLSENFVDTALPSKILKSHKISCKASFPDSSAFNNGFSPRRFLIESNEANSIYSKMIFTNVLISQLKGDKTRKQSAREELWKAQDSSLFSPGNEHLRHELRKTAYSSLLRAEKLSREKGKFISSLVQYDFDFDGKMEYLFQDAKINCYIQLTGAGIFELDYLPKDWNYLACGSDGGNIIGNTRRIAFADVLLPPVTKVSDLDKGFPKGSRLVFNEEYEALSQDRKGKSCFKLPPLQTPAENDRALGNIEIQKCYLLKKDILTVTHALKNTGNESIECYFSSKINFSFAGTGDEYVRFYTVDNNGKDTYIERLFENTNILKILDVKNEVQILLSSTNVFSGCLKPVFKDELYQAARILPLFSILLEGGKTWTNEFTLKFSH